MVFLPSVKTITRSVRVSRLQTMARMHQNGRHWLNNLSVREKRSGCGHAASRLRSIACGGLIALTVASCNRAQPVVLNAPRVAQDTNSQVACTQQVAAEIVRVQHTLQASNDGCVVYWRSLEVRQHPERSFYLECSGLKAYPDPQPPGHPISLAECDRKLRERQARMGVPVTGMSDEEKATYRATWGGG